MSQIFPYSSGGVKCCAFSFRIQNRSSVLAFSDEGDRARCVPGEGGDEFPVGKTGIHASADGERGVEREDEEGAVLDLELLLPPAEIDGPRTLAVRRLNRAVIMKTRVRTRVMIGCRSSRFRPQCGVPPPCCRKKEVHMHAACTIIKKEFAQ